ncbi:HAMP domain-containing protein [Streptacidiphilus sp. ASG 303]|uniref:hybrid sensor histidine kinase/response regulator n=1 Tax=Streptacidiphilus sp. ASG 303 TaxID=2896847 RepID=UPI001E32E202|nr:HAMP domain-containing protein [Streptacidiphilus sp. ASG 303]MCD0484708.1 HAMP domain-containing protein [Streptacidiphilus sp. ASG 303]
MRDGNFRRRLTVPGDGVMAEIAAVFNEVAERNQHLTGELARVRRVVGREGRLSERLEAGAGEGAWGSAVDNCNALIDDLARPMAEVGRVLGSIAEGDLEQRMELRSLGADGLTHPLRGEFLKIGRTVNGLVDQLSEFTDEVTRVAIEVGTEGKLGGQARVRGMSGSWKDLTDSVNTMAGRLTAQVRDIALVTTAVAKGDLSRKVTVHVDGEMLELKNTVNTMVDQLSSFGAEVTRVAREVGTEGQLGGQAQVPGVAGIWKDLTDNVNFMANNLTAQVREIAQVTTAVANGDLSQKITVTARGEIARLAMTINAMTETLRTFAAEVNRVASEVASEGRLGGQAMVPGAAGVWKDLTDSVNNAFRDLTAQVRDIAQVTTAVASGDLTQKVTVDVSGEMLELKNTVNTMVDQLSAFGGEVTRVAREIGAEGRLGGQAQVPGVAGTWKDLTDSVNNAFRNLTGQVRNIAQVTTAVASGDLSQKVTVDVSGEMLELKNTVNTMVDQLSAFAAQVTRVARDVGVEGRLGGQARVPGVAGVWRDLTDSVNFMANNLTDQVRNIAQVTTAVARGDLSQKIEVDARGEILELKNTINTMVDQLSAFAEQVTRVAREVGTEGMLGGQASVPGVAGTWKDLTDNVNFMANNLTGQVRNIAQVATAVARGDLSQKIEVDARGEILELKTTINTMVDQLGAFADEVTRVAREVGTEGRLGGQALVPGVSGTWKDLTDNVNLMANNLTGQVRNIAEVTTAVARGDVSKKITVDARGEILELVTTVNTMVDQLSAFADEVTRVAREVGTEGILGGQARVRGVSGIWKDLTDNVNFMASNLTSQVRNIAQVATAVANGDLSKKITIEAQGEVAALAGTLNTMVDQLSAFAVEVTRVAREVGTEGILGGQANVPGVAGIWKDLTENVNLMANNLTGQVRNIALVTTAVANGDLSKKIDVDARGEMLELKTTLNTMVDQLSAFGVEVTRVAREVGAEGRLGGQARVPGVAGTWQDLTESVNELAGNLTRQVRAIAQVATAVTRGDLSLRIDVDASGELDELKDNINQMIANLRETTRTNKEQDWLKTNLARISGLLQGRRDLEAVAALIMSELTPVVSAQHGAFFLAQPGGRSAALVTEDDDQSDVVLRLIGSYGYQRRAMPTHFRLGESLIGQAAVEKRPVMLRDAPPGYLKIASGLGEASPAHVIVLPVMFEGRVLGVIELASFSSFTSVVLDFLEQIAEMIGVTVNNISVNTKTEGLLLESQRLTAELSMRSAELEARQEELEHTNEELQEKAEQLAQQNRDIEIKNSEIEEARQVLEERAEQLALASRYKSEFLANMSHELRTPLNSLLILAKLLADNNEGNLSPKQVEFSETIHGAGTDLLQLINDILDLSKVEAGKMEVRPSRIALVQLVDYVEAAFRPLTADKGLDFAVRVSPDLPVTLHTDEQRLQQVLRNLLSNAVKFTDGGAVELLIRPAGDDVPAYVREQLLEAGAIAGPEEPLVAFSVTDTGIGIPSNKLREIFEPFRQADGTTSRKYGGTGLGLSISREIARLLGGEIHAESELGRGSTFTLYLPLRADEPDAERRGGEPYPAEAARSGHDAAAGSPAEHWAQEVRELAEERRRGTAADRRRAAAQRDAAHRDAGHRAGPPPAAAPEPPAPPAPRALPRAVAFPGRGAAAADDRAGEGQPFQGRFEGEKVLIVDDDIRNVFALTSVLEQYGLTVLYAENGREGIEVLEQHDDVALVLMDIMMPEMDGYATTEAIRSMPQFAGLPIIALTAKAMKGDREKSIEAGASDHVTKPVDTDHLLGVMDHWLRARGR